MSQQSVDVTNMTWRPALVALTLMPNPNVDNGVATRAFVDPSAISAVWRAQVKVENEAQVDQQTYTIVHCCHYHVVVVETPEQVALLRDRALGHSHSPQGVD
jgi:hypothetical protein